MSDSTVQEGSIIADNSIIKNDEVENEYIFNNTIVNYHTTKIKMLDLITKDNSAVNYQYH